MKSDPSILCSVLCAFGLSTGDLEIFKENVFWIHTCNCYPWWREYNDKKTGKLKRQDRSPNKTQINNCLGHRLDRLLEIDIFTGVVLMGKLSTQLFPQIYEGSEKFTDLVRKTNIRNDIIDGIDILPIYHQSKNSRIFNDPIDKSINEELKSLLKESFFKWIQ